MSRPSWSYAGGKTPPGRPTTPSPSRSTPNWVRDQVRPGFGSTSGGSSGSKTFTPPAGPTSRTPGVTIPSTGQFSGTFGSQRLGGSPDRFEAFPYGSITLTEDQALNMYDRLSPAYQNWLTSIARTPGFGAPTSTGRAMWARFVQRSIELQNDGLFMSPQQMAEQVAASRGIGLDLGDPASYGGSGSRGGYGRGGFGGGGGGGTSRSIDLSSPTQARSIIMQTMQGVLGRDPSADEIAQFTKSLNEAQQANPTVVTAEGDTVIRSGGIEADVFAMDFVRNQEEFQEVQGTQFYRALMGALGGGGI